MTIRSIIAERLDPYHQILVWGAGNMGRNALCRWLPLAKVVAVIDSNQEKRGRSIQGVSIRPPESLGGIDVDCIVICTQAHAQVREFLRSIGVKTPCFFIHELFLPQAGQETMSAMDCLSVDLAVNRYLAWPLFLLQKPQVLVNCSFRWIQAAGSHWLYYPLYPLLYVFHYFACVAVSIQLPHNTKIGPGLIFGHYGAIVFSSRARIGAFFTIYHGCTVGTDDSGSAPVIGDFVTQYSGSHVLGGCRIGNGARIGANAVALGLDAPPGSTVVGIPARVLSTPAKDKQVSRAPGNERVARI
jgi:serine O-acetyltransferase